MTMNSKHIERYLMRFLEVMDCSVIEKTPSSVLVKLSPEADKELTGRSYYWGFVERTGVPAETITMRFIFDPAAELDPLDVARMSSSGFAPMAAPPGSVPVGSPASVISATFAPPTGAPLRPPPQAVPARTGVSGTPGLPGVGAGGAIGTSGVPGTGGAIGTSGVPGTGGAIGTSVVPGTGGAIGTSGVPGAAASAGTSETTDTAPAVPDTILGRYFGVTLPSPIGRIPTDTLTFGSRRLEQIFQIAKRRGACVRLFEERKKSTSPLSTPYSTWFCINYKVELVSDMKREELHSLGIHMGTGQIEHNFWNKIKKRKLDSRLPPGVFLTSNKITLNRATTLLEAYLEKKLKTYDHKWATDAHLRLVDELQRIDGFYGSLIEDLQTFLDNETVTRQPEADQSAQSRQDGARLEYKMRREEAEWQYKPRIRVSAVNCGLFHLSGDEAPLGDETR
ncbi:MAG: hypothetical protein H7X86_02485 [Gorillibacterium sp.]|nr:hypothetical protein [Gorillibacterium sp.]